jgi:acyl carrier protein phosphodiesterase
MRSQNWLLNYRTIEGIQKSLTGLSKRASFDSKMELAPQFLLEKENEFEIIFFAFFKDLETFAREKLIEIQLVDANH